MTTASARVLAFSALLALVGLSGCTIWFAIWQDPGGLPCAEGQQQCLVGYTCVDDVCMPAAAAEAGDTCSVDEECAEGLVCTNVYDDASCGGDISCELGRATDDGSTLRCRRTCDPAGAVTQCAPGERCWPDAAGTGWCQAGVCEAPSDCGTNPLNGATNVCYGAGIHPGGSGSGLCTSSCDPLECNPTTGCPDCPLFDVDGDGQQDVMGCEPYEQVLVNMGCILAGTVPHGGTCDGVTTNCQPGSFCFVPEGANAGYCARICRVGGGNPACDASFPTCNSIDGVMGFCG